MFQPPRWPEQQEQIPTENQNFLRKVSKRKRGDKNFVRCWLIELKQTFFHGGTRLHVFNVLINIHKNIIYVIMKGELVLYNDCLDY